MNAFLKLQQIRKELYGTERNLLKNPERITFAVYLHNILFGTHGGDTVTEKEFNTVLQMTLEHALSTSKVLNGQ